MFKTGDRVLIKKYTRFYTQAPDIPGTIISPIKDSKPKWVTVEFDNGYFNDYRIFRTNPDENDLVPARNLKITMIRKQ